MSTQALMDASDELTLVLDIGKSHAKLLMIDAQGEVVAREGRANRSVVSALGYPALDVHGLAQWITGTLQDRAETRRCTRAITSTHGAAFVALGGQSLAWEPIDYEFDGVSALDDAYQARRDGFEATLAPDLPAGLNAARQLHWLQHTHPHAWARTQVLLPYAQYWAWWLCGLAASEVSSLGCHTQLWRPLEARLSDLAHHQGWAARFAPLRPAWQGLGPVQPERARTTGLPTHCQVHVGVHDSNACLAGHLHGGARTTLVSTGTWIVVMAPGASAAALDPQRDMLANVSVRGETVPTARFMGGRELGALCAGASPALASLPGLAELLRQGVQALPTFAGQGGPFAGAPGTVLRAEVPLDPAMALDAGQRASLGALYCAQVTAYLLARLHAPGPVVIDGPFADNLVYRHVLAALRPPGSVRVGTDAVEGTARGAWLLTRWGSPAGAQHAAVVEQEQAVEIQHHHRHWLELLARR